MHIYVEMSQENTWYSYLKQIKMSLSFTKLEKRRTEEVLPGCVGTCGRGRMWGKGMGW
jgi:hypothetical protein